MQGHLDRNYDLKAEYIFLLHYKLKPSEKAQWLYYAVVTVYRSRK